MKEALLDSLRLRANKEKKLCDECGKRKTLVAFFSLTRGSYKIYDNCTDCRRAERSSAVEAAKKENPNVKNGTHYALAYPIRSMLSGARGRAKKAGLPFNIDESDIIIPSECPVLGIPIARSQGCVSHNSPTIDRMIPALGYVKGNVMVISHRANSIKMDASHDELLKVAAYVKSIESASKP